MKTLSPKVLRAMLGVARQFERNPKSHEFFDGRVEGIAPCCFLAALGRKLRTEAKWHGGVAEEVFGLDSSLIYAHIYYSAGEWAPQRPAKEIAADIRKWVAEIKAAQATQAT